MVGEQGCTRQEPKIFLLLTWICTDYLPNLWQAATLLLQLAFIMIISHTLPAEPRASAIPHLKSFANFFASFFPLSEGKGRTNSLP